MADGTRDILGRKAQSVKEAYSSDSFHIAIAGDDHQFMLVQNLQWNYGQNVTRLFDLENSEFQAYVASRPQGNLTLANIVTNFDGMIDFLQTYGDVCSADTNKNIQMEIVGKGDTGLCRIQGGSLRFTQPVLVSAVMSIAVADYIVNNNMSFIFASAQSAGRTAGSTN